MQARHARPLIAAFALLALACTPALANDLHQDVAFDPSTFAEQKRELIDALDSKDYFEISEPDKIKVVDALDRMEQRLAQVTSIEQLADKDKVAVFNDQELVNALLTGAREDSRLVCKREKKVGSNLPTNICMTVAQRREAQDKAQRGLQGKMRVRLCLGGGGTTQLGSQAPCSSGG